MADSKQTVVAFLTLSSDSSANNFVNGIEQELSEHTMSCKYVQLSNYDLGLFHTQRSEGYDAVVLLHSVQVGRNTVTDVPDAKYNNVLPHLKYKYGAGRVAVVVYSMRSLQHSYNKYAMMLAFKDSQPTTFLCSNCVIQCNNLQQMDTDYRSKLKLFLIEASNSLNESRKKVVKRSLEPSEEVGSKEGNDNAVALLNHTGPDISDTIDLSNDLKTQFNDTSITFKSMDEGSLTTINLFKSVLVLVDKKDFENKYMFAYLTTSYVDKIGPEGHLGFLIMEEKDKPDHNSDSYKSNIFEYSREDGKYIFEESTLNDMTKWFTDVCNLVPKTNAGLPRRAFDTVSGWMSSGWHRMQKARGAKGHETQLTVFERLLHRLASFYYVRRLIDYITS